MPGSDPKTGDVYYYPYVWKRQQGGSGLSEKDRPCCVALRLSEKAAFRGANTFLLALSQSGPPEDGYGIPVPKEIIEGLKRLDATVETHLVTSEFNSDVSDHPSFEDCEYLGSIPMEFLKPILLQIVEHLRTGSGEVNRTGT